jgi:hypothetical protein
LGARPIRSHLLRNRLCREPSRSTIGEFLPRQHLYLRYVARILRRKACSILDIAHPWLSPLKRNTVNAGCVLASCLRVSVSTPRFLRALVPPPHVVGCGPTPQRWITVWSDRPIPSWVDWLTIEEDRPCCRPLERLGHILLDADMQEHVRTMADEGYAAHRGRSGWGSCPTVA